MKLVANFKEPPLGKQKVIRLKLSVITLTHVCVTASLITSQLLRPVDKIDIEWIPDSTSSSGSKSFDSDVSLCRYLAEYFNSSKLYGVSPIDRVEVNVLFCSWVPIFLKIFNVKIFLRWTIG